MMIKINLGNQLGLNLKELPINTGSILGMFLSSLLLMISSSCTQKTTDKTDSEPINIVEDTVSNLITIPYQVNQPDETIELPLYLDEISGLGFYSDKEIACVQDEEGIVVFYDVQQKEISDKIPFGEDGDYEGIEAVNGIIYVLRNDGTLFRIENIGTTQQRTKKLKTKLDITYDTEGLTYNPTTEQLLIACKGKGGEGTKYQNKKSVYTYDLKTEKFNKIPKFTIPREELYFFIQQHDLVNLAFYPNEPMPFQPSAIAIHPPTGYYYILSAENRMLLVLNEQEEIIYLTQFFLVVYY